MIPKKIQEILINNGFKLEFEEACAVYRKYFQTDLFGEMTVDIFDGEGFDNDIHIALDCEDIKTHPISNIENVVKNIENISV